MKTDVFWIPGPWRGRLAIASRPRGWDWLEDEVSGWRDAGLDVVVSLLENDEATQLGLENERAITESKGLRYLSFPIQDRGVPSSTQDTMKIVRDLTSALTGGRNVAVHCRQGVGRSGLLAVAALMTAGEGLSEAVKVVSNARGVAVPETPGQMQWLNQLGSDRLALAS